MREITDYTRWRMRAANMFRPLSLDEADLSIPFVHHREYGVFYVVRSYHQMVMGILLGFERVTRSVSELFGVKPNNELREAAEGTEGTCFKSSVKSKTLAWNQYSLSEYEKDIFGPIEYLEG